MSTVIVKENETLDSAIRRWKKKCANEISAARRLTRSPAFAARKKRKPLANALTNKRSEHVTTSYRTSFFLLRQAAALMRNTVSFACFCRCGTARIYAVV